MSTQPTDKSEIQDIYIAFLVIGLFGLFYHFLTRKNDTYIEDEKTEVVDYSISKKVEQEPIIISNEEVVMVTPAIKTNTQKGENQSFLEGTSEKPKERLVLRRPVTTISGIKLPKKEKESDRRMSGEDFKNIKTLAQLMIFKANSAEIDPESAPALDMVADILKKYPAAKMRIESHTFNDGQKPESYLRRLTNLRAVKIKEQLLVRGVKNSLRAQGFGSQRPKVNNTTGQGQYLNRRIEFKIFY